MGNSRAIPFCLQHIRLSGLAANVGGTETPTAYLNATKLILGSGITELDISGNALPRLPAPLLFGPLPHLARINVGNLGLGDDGLADLTSLLKKTPSLRAVSLERNLGFDDLGIMSDFGEEAATHPSLVEISVNNCALAGEVGETLIKKLSKSCKLQVVKIGGSSFGGSELLPRVIELMKNSAGSLKEIDLSDAYFEEDRFVAFTKAVMETQLPVLEALWLHGNQRMPHDVLAELLDAVELLGTVKRLGIPPCETVRVGGHVRECTLLEIGNRLEELLVKSPSDMEFLTPRASATSTENREAEAGRFRSSDVSDVEEEGSSEG